MSDWETTLLEPVVDKPGTELAVIPKELPRGRHRRPKPPRASAAHLAGARYRDLLVLLSRLRLQLPGSHGGK